MFILIAILVSLLVPLLVLALSYSRVRTGILWLISLLGAITACALVIAARGQLPIAMNLMSWQSEIFQPQLTLLVDEISWPFAVAVMMLPIAVLLTDMAQVRDLDPHNWAASLALGGVGLMAVVAGDPSTLLLAWAVIDITESVLLLIRVAGSQERERVVVGFSVRTLGLLFLVIAILQATAFGEELTFGTIPPAVAGWLLLTAGLRLGVFPPQQPHLLAPHRRRGLGTLIRLVPVASSLVLLGRVAAVGVVGLWVPVIMLLATFAMIWGAFSWIRAENEFQARPFWVLGLGALALISAVQGLSIASLSWGLALVFSGATLFLFSVRQRWLFVFPFLGAVGFSALPLTPAWEGSSVFGAIAWFYRVPFLLGLAFLLVGYLRHAQPADDSEDDFERWMWIVYPLGLAVLPLTHFGLVYLNWRGDFWGNIFQAPGWWTGLISLGVAIILLVRGHRGSSSPPDFIVRLGNFFNLSWVYRFFWWLYRSLSRFVDLFSRLLEGEGGVLWALVLLIILLVTINLWGAEGGYEF